jgi:hypothetical protein
MIGHQVSPEGFRWIVSQEGSRETYSVPLAFHRLNLLRLFYVDTWCRWGRSLLKRGPKGCRALATHFQPELPPERVVSFNAPVIFSRALFQFRKNRLPPDQVAGEWCRFGEKFARMVRDHLRRQQLSPDRDFFFGFSTNCLETIEYLRERRVLTVLDQVDPAKVEEDLCMEEAERWPGWSKMPGRMPQAYWERLQAEWETADLVLVNSDWSAQALMRQGVPCEKIIVVPLAIDFHSNFREEPIKADGTLKVLWLGSVILRKGIQYLIEAARLLRGLDIEFLLAGPVGISQTALGSFPPNVKILGRITRDQLGEVYRKAHVFVLPTISDGFAVTQLEAMAHGLPVVTTPNCGRVVTHGVDGLIVPARDSKALASALETIGKDRTRLREMSRQALRTIQKYDLALNARLIHDLALQRRACMPWHHPLTKMDRQVQAALCRPRNEVEASNL